LLLLLLLLLLPMRSPMRAPSPIAPSSTGFTTSICGTCA
jgi:hypothetical protein